jgi:hypothetical protein
MPFLSPTSKCQVLKTSRRAGRTDFLGTLGGSYGFLQKRERMAESCLCNGFFKTYALIPC